MRRALLLVFVVCVGAGLAVTQYGKPASSASVKSDFNLTASYIEACSCDMFCPCYFNDHAKMHGNRHFCEFNMAIRVDKGHYRSTKLDGVKVWLTGDLGDQWSKGKAGWLIVNFDPAVTEAQQAAMKDILFQLYPLEWTVLGVDTKPIQWNIDRATGVAAAKLGSGEGEVILQRYQGENPKKDIAMTNVKYWGAQSNDGFLMWKNKRHFYEGHGKKLDYSGTNGFLVTIHFSGQAKAAVAD